MTEGPGSVFRFSASVPSQRDTTRDGTGSRLQGGAEMLCVALRAGPGLSTRPMAVLSFVPTTAVKVGSSPLRRGEGVHTV